jgi:hypothetical protein
MVMYVAWRSAPPSMPAHAMRTADVPRTTLPAITATSTSIGSHSRYGVKRSTK